MSPRPAGAGRGDGGSWPGLRRAPAFTTMAVLCLGLILRATGHYDVVSGGLRVWTEGNGPTDKVAEYIDTNTPLAPRLTNTDR